VEKRGEVREGKNRLARFINFTGTKELFKLQRADQPRLSLISLISCLPLLDVPTSFPVFPARVICSMTRCGGNNYYAPNAVNLIYPFSVRNRSHYRDALVHNVHICTSAYFICFLVVQTSKIFQETRCVRSRKVLGKKGTIY